MLSSKVKILMAIIVPILLIVGGGIYWFSGKVANANISYTIATNRSKNYGEINNTPMVTTIINNGEGYITLEIKFNRYYTISNSLVIPMNIFANISLGSKFSSDSFIFSAQELDNLTAGYGFIVNYSKAHNAEIWSNNKITPGAWAPHKAYIGFTPKSHSFNASGRVMWGLYNYTTPHTYTLRLKALCKIGSIEVPTIIDISIKTQ